MDVAELASEAAFASTQRFDADRVGVLLVVTVEALHASVVDEARPHGVRAAIVRAAARVDVRQVLDLWGEGAEWFVVGRDTLIATSVPRRWPVIDVGD